MWKRGMYVGFLIFVCGKYEIHMLSVLKKIVVQSSEHGALKGPFQEQRTQKDLPL